MPSGFAQSKYAFVNAILRWNWTQLFFRCHSPRHGRPQVIMGRKIGAARLINLPRKRSSTCCASAAVSAFLRIMERCAQRAASSFEPRSLICMSSCWRSAADGFPQFRQDAISNFDIRGQCPKISKTGETPSLRSHLFEGTPNRISADLAAEACQVDRFYNLFNFEGECPFANFSF